MLTVGKLRALLAELPDDARVLPDWAEEPADSQSVVAIVDGQVAAAGSRPGEPPYLAIAVKIVRLEDLPSTDDDMADLPNNCLECARSYGPHYRGPCEHGG